jgi:hypothetical protein
MSYYDDERPRRHQTTRERRTRDDYDTDPYYKNSGGGGRDTDVVRKSRNDSFSSVEEVQRDFPPAGGYSRKTTEREVRRARSAGGRDRHGGNPYDDRSSYHDDYASSKRGSKRYDDRREQSLNHHFPLL